MRYKHGDAALGHTVRLYNIWVRMKGRCSEHADEEHRRRYYSRGIRVCDEWAKDYCTFKEWALNNGYDDSLELDRKDNNKGYSPDNCRWITHGEQTLNTERTRYFDVNGERKPLKEWCNITGANYKQMHQYLMNGKEKEIEEWFSDALLKINEGRESEIVKPHIVRERVIQCAICGVEVVANSGRQKFCVGCYRKKALSDALEGYYRRKAQRVEI